MFHTGIRLLSLTPGGRELIPSGWEFDFQRLGI